MAIICEVNKMDGKISEKFAKNSVKKIFSILKIKNAEISIAIIDNKKIKEFNRRYRKKNKPTDILSFGERDIKDFKGVVKKDYLGEIILSYPEIKKQSIEDKETIRNVFRKLLTHGILHLLGYEHEKNIKEEKKMFEFQEEILKKLKIKNRCLK